MIRYTLACSQRHEFEAWFANSEAFEKQQADGAIACPLCGDTGVGKTLMTPGVATARAKERVRLAANPARDPELLAMMRKVREHLTSEAEYVGNRFAEEARRIHFDEAEKRGIYGEATSEEVRSLAEDGVEFHPLPPLPEDHN